MEPIGSTEPAVCSAMAKISREDARARVQKLPGWDLEGNAITRQFTFAGFPDAVSFVVRLGFAAEAADHHPDFLVNFKRVTVTYTTHSDGGLTDKDFDGAATAAALATAIGAK